MKERVCVVIVTYGNRFKYLKKVVEALLSQGVCKIIVVDNGSEPESKKALEEYAQLKEKVTVLWLPENRGSAGGFKVGMEVAYKDADCEFIWLLDDDNMPLEGALEELVNVWNNIDHDNRLVALCSFRPEQHRLDRIIQIAKTINKRSENVFYYLPMEKNYFYYFHIKKVFEKLFKTVHTLFNFSESQQLEGDFDIDLESVRLALRNKLLKMDFAPYGGLFFKKEIIDVVGFPIEEFYLYADDTEWTYRITRNNGSIFLCINSQIKDLEGNFKKSVLNSSLMGSFNQQ
ncbi:MAG: glycosyltransferase [Fervidobacterium sp.]|uniref:glycosyltransferase n=1 Tax=Fervidobacterium sp. TaxID=1871331 RepID=UPI0025BA416F|nr:glycosyltransferase [Fervidobacterium sp.]NPU88329.1 glycosyltransferase [Fervidobacterium sp.]